MKNNESNYTITKTEYSPISFYSHDFMFLKIPETKIVNILKQNKKMFGNQVLSQLPNLEKNRKVIYLNFNLFRLGGFLLPIFES